MDINDGTAIGAWLRRKQMIMQSGLQRSPGGKFMKYAYTHGQRLCECIAPVKLLLFLLLSTAALAQAPYTLLPWPRACFVDPNSNAPLAGGFVSTYVAGTTTPLNSYSDSSGSFPNTNPVNLDSAGCAPIWIAATFYKIVVRDSNSTQIFTVDNISNPGALGTAQFVLLTPPGASLQTIIGPLAASYFQGTAPHTTSTGVRVSLLDPTFTLDTAANPPNVHVTSPAVAGQIYTIPDPGMPNANFVLSPGGTTNTLDCTAAGLTCKRTAYIYMEGAGCNNTTAGLGWDTFGANSATPLCVTGTNIQKGVLALPGAATIIQEANGHAPASATCIAAYPAATAAGNLLQAEIVVDTSRTVTGVTDGTNAYTRAVAIANGATNLEIWYFNGSSVSVGAGTVLTATFSGAGNCGIVWREYAGILTAGMLDKTATNTGTGTAVTTGTTAGTAQNTELVIAAVAVPGTPFIDPQAGWAKHASAADGSSVEVFSAGKIQQATSTQAGGFQMGSSLAWASAIATFKVNVAGTATAQRTIALPQFFLATSPINLNVKWQAQRFVVAPVTVNLGAALVCTTDGNTDDPAFLAATTATPAISASSANVLTTTPLNSLTSTGCAAGNTLHLQLQRLRYSASDTYEGWIQVTGAAVQFGITQ